MDAPKFKVGDLVDIYVEYGEKVPGKIWRIIDQRKTDDGEPFIGYAVKRLDKETELYFRLEEELTNDKPTTTN